MTTIGTTTATAILPPCDKPPEIVELSVSLVVAKGGAPDEEEVWAEDDESVNTDEGWGAGLAVDVITTTEGGSRPPVEAGLCVTTEVIRTTELAAGGSADVAGMMELVVGAMVGVGNNTEVEGSRREELD